MTATERLRQLLDERGVEWMGTSYTKPTQGHPTNTSLDEEYHNAVFIEYVDGSVLRLFDLTPEQAVEATLGRDEVADLRQALADLWPRASFTMCPENRESWLERLAELGVEVDE